MMDGFVIELLVKDAHSAIVAVNVVIAPGVVFVIARKKMIDRKTDLSAQRICIVVSII